MKFRMYQPLVSILVALCSKKQYWFCWDSLADFLHKGSSMVAANRKSCKDKGDL